MSPAKVCPKHSKPFPCGSCRIESARKPPQKPEVPLEELKREAEIIMAVAIIPKKSSPTISAREQFGLTRREIAWLLDEHGVAKALTDDESRQYRQLAWGNLSERELGGELGLAKPQSELQAALNEQEVKSHIDEIEKKIIQRALHVGIRLCQKVHLETDTFDREGDDVVAAQDREIASSGGAAIGGSVVSAGHRYGAKSGSTFRRKDKALDSFEKMGRIREVRGHASDADITGGEVDFDDYSEESFA